MLRRVGASDRRAPRPAHEIELGDAALRQNIINRSPEVRAGLFRNRNRLVGFGRLIHLRRASRSTVRPYIDQINVEAALSEQVHHRHAVDRQVEACFRRVCGAMNEEQRFVRRKGRHALRVLVANIEFDAGSDDGIIASVVVSGGDCTRAPPDSAKLITRAEQITRRLITTPLGAVRNAATV
jgi:hypothetical protein